MFTSATRSQSFPLSTRVGLVYIHRETEKRNRFCFMHTFYYLRKILFQKNL